MEFLQRQIGPFPVWAWGLIVIGGAIVGYIIIKKYTSSTAQNGANTGGSTLGGNPSGQGGSPSLPSEIDPLTGVPYTVEEQVDPNTGIPFYYTYPNGSAPPSPVPAPQGGPVAPPSGPSGPAQPVSGPPSPSPLPLDPGRMPAQPVGGVPGTPAGGRMPAQPVNGRPGPPVPAQPVRPPAGHPSGGRMPAQPVRPRRTVTVKAWPQPESSLWSIWQRVGGGVPWSQWEGEVVKANHLSDPNRLYPGQELVVP